MPWCCGDSHEENDEKHNILRPELEPLPVIHQPSPHPGTPTYTGNSTLLPSISPPPQIHEFGQNGPQPQTLHPQSHLPPYTSSSTPGHLHPYVTPGSPPPSSVHRSISPSYTYSHAPSSYVDPIRRPSPAHSPGSTGTVSSRHNYNFSVGSHGEPSTAAQSDEGKMSVSIDFGTTFSGVAYASSRISGGKVQQLLQWPGSFETFRKIPTCLLYDENGEVLAWGLEAKNSGPMEGTSKCEWFKLFLEPHVLRDESCIDPRLRSLPPGKSAIDLIIDFLSCLWEYAKEQITRDIGAVADLDSADVWLTVPAAWDTKGCEIMREAAIRAGLVQASHGGDRDWRNRLHIITEPEAASVHCAQLSNLHQLKLSQNFMICDAGGGTVDLAVYRLIGQLAHLEIAEISARSGANCGSLFLDLRFRDLVRTLLAQHPAHLDPASLAYFMHAFSETEKLAYQGEIDDDNIFQFTCFNVEDPDDPTVGLINGELAIPGNLLRREVFDPVVSEVLELIEGQLRRVNERIDALLLVGGFSGSEYLFKRVKEQFGRQINVIARPPDADTATARGAAQYGLARRPLVSSIVVPRSYIMKVKLPAEQEDWQKRPAYIKGNSVGVSICENRLQYLVTRGAILRKGQRIATKLCKFSQNAQDRIFVATLYTSDSDRSMRYTDEGEIMELCQWTVDLGNLPSFQQHANSPQRKGFYTEFDLVLELDSAEVRGILMHGGREWGRVVF